ncbi:guanine nucleotide-releasing factor 2 isoform X11 [Hyposmocoma kahamanoa]|uniref:guanine nucleotide-releasing factor 2 isoform X11 n=1 Tax=Hyposmocoma kahamanoa TaxID=1477025 RepID=UPI000E6D745C|nr:guanine nucleotide-releasing factor 2 isoform X11 [Hyposmocoma kahamanoa]
MPHYDETFIHDDNLNQRRNKRSYRVYKTGLSPLHLLERSALALEERGTSVIKRNIKNIKHRNNRDKSEPPPQLKNSPAKYKTPDIIVDHCPRLSVYYPNKYNDIRNNNVQPLSPCKSFDNLVLYQTKQKVFGRDSLRNGISLQNLADEENLKHYSSPSEDYLTTVRRDDISNSYSVLHAKRRPMQRCFSRVTATPGVGVYRQIPCDGETGKDDHENESSGEPGSGHRGSLRGANKLARRARSFKDDLLERISNMRSPQQHHPPHLSSAIRSHSPLSPKLRNMGTKPVTVEEGEVTPAKELERLVKEVTFGLKHFSDVITKRKLEMLPDNGTIVFESIANIHKAIKPYCGRSPQLMSAVKRLCNALATLIRLCDEITAVSLRADAGNEEMDTSTAALSPEHVSSVVKGVTSAVEEVASLAQQHMTRPALSPRPALVSPRASTQRNSLPDIPLTPKERSLLTGEGNNEPTGVRASHSSESVLDAPDTPPPKPARPNRKIELAPPLPPKRKSANDNSLLALSIDRLSLQSHSSGSLDSMLNVSNDEERNAHENSNNDVFAPPNSETGICNCNSSNEIRSSLESHESHFNAHTPANHNRYVHHFSNESGFVSVGHAEMSTEHSFTSSFSSHQYTSHTDSAFDTTDCVSEMKCTMQSFERSMNILNMNSVATHSSLKLASITSDDSLTPPELPVKTRRNIRADVQQHFPSVEIRQSPVCSLHGDARPHTLADHHPPRPPPLPLKKKHMFQNVAYSVMAYMEMFGNCSHPPNNTTAPPDMFRHSIHTYNLASAQHASGGGLTVQRQQVQRSIAQSLTLHHLGTPPFSGSEDSVNITTSSGTSPVPPEVPPALPPKMSKNKQVQMNSSNELLPPPSPSPSPRPHSHNSSADETVLHNVNSDDSLTRSATPGKFPLEDELEMLVQQPPTPSPVPSQKSESSSGPTYIDISENKTNSTPADPDDIILQTDISQWLLLKAPSKDGPEVRGGNPDALIVLATKATKDFAYQEAFLATYRTWVSPSGLVARLVRRAHHFRPRPHELRSTLSLLTRVVADLTMSDLDQPLMQEIMKFIYWLVEVEELPIAKALRQILVDKQKQIHFQQSNHRYEYETPCYGAVSLRRDTLLDFKATDLAEQMTLLDAALFVRITTAEVLSWPRDQSEESSPNLTRFTEHFNKMSYWARSRILEQDEAKEREKYASKFLKVMKALRKMNNFNSYLALVSALDSPPVRRLGWPRAIDDALLDHCAIIDSSSSFRAYRLALAETQPPCIPYIGLVLQDLTFVHIGNPDLLQDGVINFTKRWQQYHIMENMKRFHKEQYKFKKNERIQAMFNDFDDVLSEEAMWQVSESIKPRGGRAKTGPPPTPALVNAPTPAPAQTAA